MLYAGPFELSNVESAVGIFSVSIKLVNKAHLALRDVEPGCGKTCVDYNENAHLADDVRRWFFYRGHFVCLAHS